MGKFISSGSDMAKQVETGTFTATGASAQIAFRGPFSVAVWGTFAGTIDLQKSFDGGTTWVNDYAPYIANQITMTAPAAFQCVEAEDGVYYRLNCSTYTSGTVNYRLSASEPATWNTGF